MVEEGEVLARVSGPDGGGELRAAFKGLVRGMLRSGLEVSQGLKIGDLDPRCELGHCYSVSDKSRAVAGGVLEALLAAKAGYGL
jgi:xanthine dehydrogenase accessory factor